MLTIYFEPHALSLDNEAGIASGHNDVELSESGRRMAAEIKAPRVAGLGIDAVYASDLKRAYDTAAIIFSRTNMPINRDWRLCECDYGEMAGNSRAKVFAMREGFISNPFPGGESYDQVLSRMKKFLEYLKEEHIGKTIFVIGHSATYISLEHLVKGVPIRDSIRSSYDTIQFPVRYVLDDE